MKKWKKKGWNIGGILALVLMCGLLSYFGTPAWFSVATLPLVIAAFAALVLPKQEQIKEALRSDVLSQEQLCLCSVIVFAAILCSVSFAVYLALQNNAGVYMADCEMYLDGPIYIYLAMYVLHVVMYCFGIFAAILFGGWLVIFVLAVIEAVLLGEFNRNATTVGQQFWNNYCVTPMWMFSFLVLMLWGG